MEGNAQQFSESNLSLVLRDDIFKTCLFLLKCRAKLIETFFNSILIFFGIDAIDLFLDIFDPFSNIKLFLFLSANSIRTTVIVSFLFKDS